MLGRLIKAAIIAAVLAMVITFLLMAHEWADREATLHSYELFAREVMPRFQGSLGALSDSRDWAAENRPSFIGAAGGAVLQAIQDHHEERNTKQTSAQDADAQTAEQEAPVTG